MIENKKPVAIITGASRGIGRALAEKFAGQGYNLTLVADQKEELMETAKLIKENDNFLIQCGNLEDFGFLQDIVDHTYNKWGRVDALINNAAWRTLETLRTISLENWEKTIRICLTAPAFLSKMVAEIMEKKHKAGVIINLSSIMAERAAGTSPAYVACKGALLSLTYELAALYGPSKIRVVAVSPGNVSTQMSQDFKDEEGKNISSKLVEEMEGMTPLKRSADPKEMAKAIYWLATEEAAFVTGTSLVIDGGFSHNFNSYHAKNNQFPQEF